jgi:hypothetical protein
MLAAGGDVDTAAHAERHASGWASKFDAATP